MTAAKGILSSLCCIRAAIYTTFPSQRVPRTRIYTPRWPVNIHTQRLRYTKSNVLPTMRARIQTASVGRPRVYGWQLVPVKDTEKHR
jgi:hypothetical protein